MGCPTRPLNGVRPGVACWPIEYEQFAVSDFFVSKFFVRRPPGGGKSVTKQQRGGKLGTKVFLDLARRFKGRPGGYTRIVKLGRRRGDDAPVSIVEFVEEPSEEAQAHAVGAKPKSAKADKAMGRQGQGSRGRDRG